MNSADVRFQSLVEKKLSFVQCPTNHGTRDRCPVASSLMIRVGKNARITGNFSPWPIPSHRQESRTMKVSHAFRRLKESTDIYGLGTAFSAQLVISSDI